MEISVKHDKENERFITEVDGFEALLDYKRKGDRIDFYHTYTPPELRGKGIAKVIVEFAFKYASENNLKVIPTCSYVQSFVERYKEYKDLIA